MQLNITARHMVDIVYETQVANRFNTDVDYKLTKQARTKLLLSDVVLFKAMIDYNFKNQHILTAVW